MTRPTRFRKSGIKPVNAAHLYNDLWIHYPSFLSGVGGTNQLKANAGTAGLTVIAGHGEGSSKELATGIGLDADNTDILLTDILVPRDLDVTAAVTFKAWFYCGAMSTNNTVSFGGKWGVWNPSATVGTSTNYSKDNVAAMSPDFATLTVASNTSDDEMIRNVGSATIAANSISASAPGTYMMTLQLTPELAGSTTDLAVALKALQMTYTRKFL